MWGLLFILAVFILDLLVIWDIFHAPFRQSATIMLVLMILIFPVFGVVVYHLVKPALIKKYTGN